MTSRTKQDWKRLSQGGIVAGIVGGLAIALYMLAMTVVRGGDPWPVFKGAAAPFLGVDRVFAQGFDATAVAVGTVSHFAVSIVWGLLFAVVAYGLEKGLTIVAGVMYGVIVWIGMDYVVLFMIGLHELVDASPLVDALINHVVFGLGVAVGFLPSQRPLYFIEGVGRPRRSAWGEIS